MCYRHRCVIGIDVLYIFFGSRYRCADRVVQQMAAGTEGHRPRLGPNATESVRTRGVALYVQGDH